MKYSGYYLILTGVVHSIIGLVLGWDILLDMHHDNWFASTVFEGEVIVDREAISWFLFSGFFWVIFGLMLQKAIEQGFVPPLSLAWGFIIMGLVMAVIMPVSGAYLFIVQGIVLLRRRSYSSNLST
ncbi:MAG: DUF6463 family protein [Paraglaciecola sp.]|uniref:DUF6463 family protein n=1 Tax=Paraglaciecola sp. TaxID=1920173 RepID=UPI0032997C65